MTEERVGTKPSTRVLDGRSLLNSASWMTGSNLVAQSCAYGSLVLLARWLTPVSFGTVAVGMAIVGIGVLIVDRGTWGAVIVEKRLTRGDLTRAFWRCMATGLVLAVAMAAASESVVDRFATGGDVAAVAAIALCLPLHAIAVVPTALLQRSMQFRRLGALNALANIGSAVAAVLIAVAGFGVWALVARQLVLYGVVAILSAVLCLPALRNHDVGDGPSERSEGTRTERWFFLFSITDSVTGSLDKLIVGIFANAAFVGLYSIAGTIALAPWKQFSAQIGQVLFAAAACEPDDCHRRTEWSVQLMAMLMLPLLPLGILVAPVVLPAVLGPQWTAIVPVFQILLVIGIGNAVVNFIAEPLTGMGFMPFRAKLILAQGVATFVALAVLVPTDGIVGAAGAQLLVFLPYAAVYFTAGARRANTSAAALWRQLRPAVEAVALQIAVSAVVLIGLVGAGVPAPPSAGVAGVAGLLACVPMMLRSFARIRS